MKTISKLIVLGILILVPTVCFSDAGLIGEECLTPSGALTCSSGDVLANCPWDGSDANNTGGSGFVWSGGTNVDNDELAKNAGVGFSDSTSLESDHSGANARFVTHDFTDKDVIGFRFVWKWEDKKGSADDWPILEVKTAAANPYYLVIAESAGGDMQLQLYNGGIEDTSTTVLTQSTWYQFGFLFTRNSDLEAKIWDASGNLLETLDNAAAVNDSPASLVHLGTGLDGGATWANHEFYFDDFTAEENGYPDPCS